MSFVSLPFCRWQRCLSTSRENWLLRGGGHDRPTARDQAPRPQGATQSGQASETERAPEPWGGLGADARVGSGRLRQDDAADGVAGRRACRWTVRSVALARSARQRSRFVLVVPCRRAADSVARGRSRCTLTPAVASDADRSRPRHSAQRPERCLERSRAGSRRLPRHRLARRAGRDGLPCWSTSPHRHTW